MYSHIRVAAVVVVIGAALAVPAVGLGGQPVIRDHGSFTDGPNPSTWCGTVAGTETASGTFTYREDASGAFHATESVKATFTATATGKSLEQAAAGVDMGAGVDNGDGTTTFTEHTAGLAIRFKQANGGVLKDADGKPILGAGSIDTVVTFDNATGDLISIQETVNGPHPFRDGVDVCGPSVAYLTSP
jgi:hypothetical protein